MHIGFAGEINIVLSRRSITGIIFAVRRIIYLSGNDIFLFVSGEHGVIESSVKPLPDRAVSPISCEMGTILVAIVFSVLAPIHCFVKGLGVKQRLGHKYALLLVQNAPFYRLIFEIIHCIRFISIGCKILGHKIRRPSSRLSKSNSSVSVAAIFYIGIFYAVGRLCRSYRACTRIVTVGVPALFDRLKWGTQIIVRHHSLRICAVCNNIAVIINTRSLRLCCGSGMGRYGKVRKIEHNSGADPYHHSNIFLLLCTILGYSVKFVIVACSYYSPCPILSTTLIISGVIITVGAHICVCTEARRIVGS